MENYDNDEWNETDSLVKLNKNSFTTLNSSTTYQKNITTNLDNSNISIFEKFACNTSLIFGPALICLPFLIQKCGIIPTLISMIILTVLSFIVSQCLIDSNRLINGIKATTTKCLSYSNLVDNLVDDTFFSISMKFGIATNHFIYSLLCLITLSQIVIYYNTFHLSTFFNENVLNLYLKNLLIVSIVISFFCLMFIINSITNRRITSVLIIIFSFLAAGHIIVHCYMNRNSFKMKNIPLIGNDFSLLYGTLIFSYCFISALPMWICENDLKGSNKKTKTIIKNSLGYATMFKLLFMFAFGYLLYTSNIFTISSFHTMENTNAYLVNFLFFFFAFLLLQSSYNHITLLYHTVSNETRSKGFALSSVLLTFFICYLFLIIANKTMFIQVINWSSIFLFGIVNFILPLFLYIEAINKTELFETNYIQSAMMDYETFVRGAVIECQDQSDEIVNLLINEKQQKEKVIYYIYAIEGYYSIKESIKTIFGFGIVEIGIKKVKYVIYAIISCIFVLMFTSLYISLYKYFMQKTLVVNIFIQI